MRLGRAAVVLLGLLSMVSAAQSAVAIDAERELDRIRSGAFIQPRIPGASYRLAVCSYGDPDDMGLGDALAALVGHAVLTETRVSSLGILRYVGRLTPRADEPLGYFERVEMLTRSQQPTASIWGHVRRERDGAIVDTYLQLPEQTVARGLVLRRRLPATMGGGELVARIGSDRLLVQRLSLGAADLVAVRAAAADVAQLRSRPEASAPVVGRLPLESVYTLIGEQGDWVRVSNPVAGTGWVRRRGHCNGGCAALLEAAAFAGSLLGYLEAERELAVGASLTDEARVFADQARAVSALRHAPPREAAGIALRLIDRWQPQPRNPQRSSPPGGAGSANLRLMARVSGEIEQAVLREMDRGRPPSEAALRAAPAPEAIREIAFEAAEATLVDPRDAELLHNLRLLFTYGGDPQRAALAGRLLDESATASRLPLAPR